MKLTVPAALHQFNAGVRRARYAYEEAPLTDWCAARKCAGTPARGRHGLCSGHWLRVMQGHDVMLDDQIGEWP